MYILCSFLHVSINGFKWGRGLFFNLSFWLFPNTPRAYHCVYFLLFTQVFLFSFPFPHQFHQKKTLKKKLPASGTEFRFTCKLIVFFPPHERYTISKTYGDTHSQGHHSAFVAFSHICCHTFSCSTEASPSKFKCSAEKHISRYMYVATLFWVKDVKIRKKLYISLYTCNIHLYKVKNIYNTMNYILRVHAYPRPYQKHIRTSAYREEGIVNINQEWKI